MYSLEWSKPELGSVGVQMIAKERLIFPLDLPDADQAGKYVRLLGNHVGVFKIGLELFFSAGPPVVDAIADMTEAGIFVDLKFHDIPATIKRAIQSGSCLRRANFVTVHCDPSLLKAVVDEVPDYTKVLAVTVLTSLDSDTLLLLGMRQELAKDPKQLVLNRASIAKKAGCAGVVCSGLEAQVVKEEFGQDLLVVTPGIRPQWVEVKKDDQKRIVTPYQAIKSGADYIVVGRPIREATDPVEAAFMVVNEIERGLEDR
jgi:orotidine-5'-phosphate decarboxylase